MLRLVAVDQPAEGTVDTLRQPLGRRPSPVDVRRSEWFNSLDQSDQAMVAEVARTAAFASAFRFCSVLVRRDNRLRRRPRGVEAALRRPRRLRASAELPATMRATR